MNSLNVCILQGNLTADPELRNSSGGNPYVVFGIAVNRIAKGEKEVSFFDCIAFGKQAEVIAEHCKKGRQVIVQGEIQQDRWEDDDGNRRSAVKVVLAPYGFKFVDSNRENGEAPVRQTKASQSRDFDEDEVPF